MTKELSIFVDESGDRSGRARYYLITLVFHDQSDSIMGEIKHAAADGPGGRYQVHQGKCRYACGVSIAKPKSPSRPTIFPLRLRLLNNVKVVVAGLTQQPLVDAQVAVQEYVEYHVKRLGVGLLQGGDGLHGDARGFFLRKAEHARAYSA